MEGCVRIVHVKFCDADKLLVFVTLIVTLYTAAPVGVPETKPVADDTLSPAGRPLAEYVSVRPAGSLALSCSVTV